MPARPLPPYNETFSGVNLWTEQISSARYIAISIGCDGEDNPSADEARLIAAWLLEAATWKEEEKNPQVSPPAAEKGVDS